MKYIPPHKLKVLMAMFFGTGALGIIMGLTNEHFFITFLGTINLCLGGFFGYVFFTQPAKIRDKKRKK
ncbi:MAG: hypothetical protein GWN01_05115 [Nitrosopumilaceae archaeon]|nr:hypothetical protein [Nitrosopumilaceae archaeon]NIU00324.1 hypothetical protein [Nitrosopumilaceae archaeon]NIU86726.1 hypothetical protein [Nitrosopumilaceae archaeon]NIV65427.1 hypothetical protein [Nitrosopumilaceae archaeon]NIX60926.1 hypothetical protein [Nitrosopumilaceae archaeon]